MRIEQARPDPEKAAKTQELHRRLRVCLSILVWVVELKKKQEKKLCHCFIRNICSYAHMHTAHCMQHGKDIIARDRVFPCSPCSVRSSQSFWL